MKEDFIHFIWKYQRFDQKGLRTTCGQDIQLINLGKLNDSDGPDFLDARIRLNDQLWVGQVEMHLTSSQWYQHAHDQDPAYDNVILHVVLEDDKRVLRRNGQKIPALEIGAHLEPGLHGQYRRLMSKKTWIPCQSHFGKVEEVVRQAFYDRLLVERFQRKTMVVANLLNEYGGDWEQTFFHLLCRNFGLKINTEPFEMLAQTLPLNFLLRHGDQLLDLEALLFGQAGFLDENFKDEYPKKLQFLFEAFKVKYQLSPMAKSSWKFLRMRPGNFPTVRIAQLARLIFQSHHLFSKVLAAKSEKEIFNMFDLKLSNYWRDHFVFDKLSKPKEKSLGQSAKRLIIINAIAPFIFYYGKERANQALMARALALLQALPAEKNSLLTGWERLGIKIPNAFYSQALIELKNEYCNRKKCLDCPIGHLILQ